MAGFDDSQVNTLVWLNGVCSVLSLCGSLTIILSYLYLEELRTFAFRLVFFVSLSDLFSCVFRLMGNPGTSGWCNLQGFGTNYFDLASFMWAAAIAIVINTVRVKVERFQPERFMLWCHITIWPSCLMISILPFFSNSYGPAGGWCWIKDSDTVDDVWRFLCFYLELLLIFCYLVYVYFRLYRYLSTGEEISSESQAMLNKVVFFPLVIFICYFFAFIRRLLEVTGWAHPPYWLAVLHVTFAALLGLGNAIVYGAINRKMRREIMNMCCNASSDSDGGPSSKKSVQMEAADINRKTMDSSVDLHIVE